jgi:hypothetical protein
MSVIEQYQVSTSNPSIVGGTGTTIKYFASNPPQSLWNSGVTGVNSPITASQLGATPSSTSANGQLSFDSVAYKLQGGQFRMVASGTATATGTPTVTATVQINTGTIASPSYATFLNGVASNAVVTTIPIAWSITADLFYDPTSQTLSGFQSYFYANAATGGTDKSQVPVAITAVQSVTAGGLYATQFGFVVGITFSTSNAANTASLYEFKIIQA